MRVGVDAPQEDDGIFTYADLLANTRIEKSFEKAGILPSEKNATEGDDTPTQPLPAIMEKLREEKQNLVDLEAR